MDFDEMMEKLKAPLPYSGLSTLQILQASFVILLTGAVLSLCIRVHRTIEQFNAWNDAQEESEEEIISPLEPDSIAKIEYEYNDEIHRTMVVLEDEPMEEYITRVEAPKTPEPESEPLWESELTPGPVAIEPEPAPEPVVELEPEPPAPEPIPESESTPSSGFKYVENLTLSDGIKPLSKEIQEGVYNLAVKYGINDYYAYLIATMYHESGFNPTAVSSTNDYGICQINKINHPRLVKELGCTEWSLCNDALTNVEAMCLITKENLENYGAPTTVRMIAMRYNSGPGNAKKRYQSGNWSNYALELEKETIQFQALIDAA